MNSRAMRSQSRRKIIKSGWDMFRVVPSSGSQSEESDAFLRRIGDLAPFPALGRHHDPVFAAGAGFDSEDQPLEQQLEPLAAVLAGTGIDPYGHRRTRVEERYDANQQRLHRMPAATSPTSCWPHGMRQVAVVPTRENPRSCRSR